MYTLKKTGLDIYLFNKTGILLVARHSHARYYVIKFWMGKTHLQINGDSIWKN